MKKKLNLLWNLKFNFFSVAERPLTFFAYFLNAKKVGRRRLVIGPATAGGLPLFPHAASVPAPALAPVRSHFTPRTPPVRLSASRPWLRHPAPLFCRSRHACAAPGPQRQNPGPCSRPVAFRLRRNRAGRSSAPQGPTFCRSRHGCAAPGPQRQNPGPCSRSVAFRLRRNRAGRSSAPPFGFAAQNRARHFAARNHPVRLSASRPWLRHPAPLFCRSRHGCAAPGPQRQNPGPPRFQLGFCCAKTGAAGRCPHWGQRARSPIFALLKCGPAYSRGVCRGTFLCSTAGPALAPRRSSAYASVSPAAKPRVRSSAPPFGFAAQNQARHFAARNHPVRLSASQP